MCHVYILKLYKTNPSLFVFIKNQNVKRIFIRCPFESVLFSTPNFNERIQISTICSNYEPCIYYKYIYSQSRSSN